MGLEHGRGMGKQRKEEIAPSITGEKNPPKTENEMLSRRLGKRGLTGGNHIFFRNHFLATFFLVTFPVRPSILPSAKAGGWTTRDCSAQSDKAPHGSVRDTGPWGHGRWGLGLGVRILGEGRRMPKSWMGERSPNSGLKNKMWEKALDSITSFQANGFLAWGENHTCGGQ